jgi:hypothetical protein
MLQIVINKLARYLFARALACGVGGRGSNSGRGMSVSRALVEDRENPLNNFHFGTHLANFSLKIKNKQDI